MADRVLKEFDQDGDGKLDRTELTAAIKSREALGRLGGPGTGNREPGIFNLQHPFVVRRFDRDGNGKLNGDELNAAREEIARMRRAFGGADGPRPGGNFFRPFDKDNDGKLSDEERAAARRERGAAQRDGGATGRLNAGADGRLPEALLQRFDKDGDGKLNDDERAALRGAGERLRDAEGGRGAGEGTATESGNADTRPAEAQARETKVNQADLLQAFDKDGNGKLDETERKAARQAFQNRTVE